VTAHGGSFPFPPTQPRVPMQADEERVRVEWLTDLLNEVEKQPEILEAGCAGADEVGPAPVTPTRSEVAEEELLRDANASVRGLPVEEETALPKSEVGFVTSVSRQGWRRLHYLGGCSRVPGIHYLNFECLGEAVPRLEEYDDVCKQCWGPKGVGPRLQQEEDGEQEELSPDTSEAEGA